jgi:hypothetical protein
VSSKQPLTEISIRNILGSKRGRCVRLATLSPPCADCLEIWKLQTSRNLKARPGQYRNCFTFLPKQIIKQRTVKRLVPKWPNKSNIPGVTDMSGGPEVTGQILMYCDVRFVRLNRNFLSETIRLVSVFEGLQHGLGCAKRQSHVRTA